MKFPGRALFSWQAVFAALLLLSSSTVLAKAQTKPTLNTLQDIGRALNSCLRPPPIHDAYPGMQMTLRFSFNGMGGIENKPRITYSTPGAPAKVRAAYERALLDSLNRCTPFPFSPDLGAAVAGQPYVFRFIENRFRPGVVTKLFRPIQFSSTIVQSAGAMSGLPVVALNRDTRRQGVLLPESMRAVGA